MSDTRKSGKRFPHRARKKPFNKLASSLQYRRMAWGSTERILRRNRKLWARLLSKARRAFDSEIIKEESEND
jgi:hypothetical protein